MQSKNQVNFTKLESGQNFFTVRLTLGKSNDIRFCICLRTVGAFHQKMQQIPLLEVIFQLVRVELGRNGLFFYFT